MEKNSKWEKYILRAVKLLCVLAMAFSVCHYFVVAYEEGQKEAVAVQTERFVVPLEEFELKDVKVEGNTVTSISDEPWIVYRPEEVSVVDSIQFDIEEMSVDEMPCRVFYDVDATAISGDYWVEGVLVSGENILDFPPGQRIGIIRIDVANKEGVTIQFNSVALIK